MKKRLLSLVLCLVMVFSLLPTFGVPALAADENGTITNPPEATDESSRNLHLTKTLTPGTNGTYDITMESWATGTVKTQGITEKIPTDFVVVVDQSGSMSESDMPTGTATMQGNLTIKQAAEGEYYYKDGDNYYRVYGVKDYLFHYYPSNYWWCGSLYDYLGTDLHWFQGSEDAQRHQNLFYMREVVNGKTYYQPVSMTVRGGVGTYHLRFDYHSMKTGQDAEFNRRDTTYVSNGNAPWYHSLLDGSVMNSDAAWWAADKAVRFLYKNDNEYTYSELAPIRTGMYINYPLWERYVGYTKLCYRDIDGVEHTLTSANGGNKQVWEYCSTDGTTWTTNTGSTTPTYNNLYTFPTTTDRITALKAALNEFAGAVANETDDFGAVDNRVSIVGFSSPNYSNTELLTHTERDISSGSTNGWQKGTCDGNASEYYGKGLVGATNGNVGIVNPKITNAITAITANGGTQPEDGLNMAYQVLTNRSNTTYTIRSGEHKGDTVDRNTVVIFFTDGQPGDYHYSDQYTEANEVVAQAKQIKDYGKTLDYGTSIFTIGVFGESDANPLTYTHETRTNSQGEDKAWKYLGGWMESYHDEYYPYSWYCLRRQWRPNSASAADNYTATPNDTIFDYMSVVSSNYPDAEQFIAPSWLSGNYTDANGYTGATDGVRHKDTAQTTNKYYRMASNQDTLVAAFLQAVTMNNEEITSDTSVPLNETAVFKDKVNLADFDTTSATYTVKWQPVKEQGGQLVNNGNAETKVNGAAYPAEGINYSGFNYSANFVTSAHPGQKLVITINGLTPKKTVGELKSNDGNAGVYGPEDENPTVSITSPTLQFPESAAKTYVIDYNAKMTVATDTTKLVGATNDTVTGTNGNFVKSGTNVTYQLNSANQAAKTAVINEAYTDVDSATVYGKLVNVENAKLGWNQITTVPASSVYYDDDLAKAETPAVTVGDGSGKITGVNDANVSMNASSVSGTFYFTFYGTGIDVYCTTHSGGGYVSAAVFKTGDPTNCNTNTRIKDEPNKAITVKNLSSVDRYNTPTVSFTGLSADTYTVKISANGTASYKLDGVRVYNPVQTGSAAETALNQTDEANATYLNLRALLLNAESGFSVTQPDEMSGEVNTAAISGILFVDMADKIVTTYHDENGNDVQRYANQFDVYKANGPKGEIYLSNNQAITFQLNTSKVAPGSKVWIGLSAPETGSGTVTITGKDGSVSVNSVMDMYYDFTVPSTGSVTITNTGSSLISVTNLKVTGVAGLLNVEAPDSADPADVSNSANSDAILSAKRAVFAPVTMSTVRMAANNGVDPEAVVDEPEVPDVPDTPDQPDTPDTPDEPDTPDQPDDPKPGWNNGADVARQILSSFLQSLMNSMKKLFGGLGGW